MDEPRSNATEFTVSEIALAVRRTVEDAFGYVRVRGEISGYRGPHSSGHVYFSLKDPGAQLSAVLFRGDAARQTVKLRDGQQVVVFGAVSVYEARGQYQLIVRALVEAAGRIILAELIEEISG